MNDPETVAIDSVPTTIAEASDSLYKRQQKDVSEMRSALLKCDRTNANSVKSAMRNILSMRIYHQMARIIRFTEEMDKIENKLYQELDIQLIDPEFNGPDALIMLVSIQERLQKVMVDSQKLLEPYMNLDSLLMVEASAEDQVDDSFGSKILSQESRQAIRDGAQTILNMLQESPSDEGGPSE